MVGRLCMATLVTLVSSSAMAAQARPSLSPVVTLAAGTPDHGGYWMPGYGSDPAKCDFQVRGPRTQCVVDIAVDGTSVNKPARLIGASFKLISVSPAAVVFDVTSGPEQIDGSDTYTAGTSTVELPRLTMHGTTYERVSFPIRHGSGRSSPILWAGHKVEFDVHL